MSKQIYLAGPMSGLPHFNFPAFNQAAVEFRKKGYIVHNPAEKDEELGIAPKIMETGNPDLAKQFGFNFREAYLWDLEKVIQSDAIYMMEGWEQSPGARGEHAAAVALKRHYPEYKILYA